MRIRTVLVSALVVIAAALSLFLLPTPAAAQTGLAEPCPPGVPPGLPPGVPSGQLTGRPAQYPPGKCQLRLSRSVVAAGESVGVSGDGYAPGAVVTVTASGVRLGTASADSSGSFSTDVVIPKSMSEGVHSVSAAGAAPGGGAQVLSASLTVTEAGAGARGDVARAGDVLPRTGGGDGIGPLTAAGSALVAIGTAAVVASRRRRNTRSA